jgi:hypothetical protein
VKKLDDKQFRPFKILEKFGASADKLELPGTWKAIHPVFNEARRIPFSEKTTPASDYSSRCMRNEQ